MNRLFLLPLLFGSLAATAQDEKVRVEANPKGLVRVNVTLQSYSAAQPWERTNPLNFPTSV